MGTQQRRNNGGPNPPGFIDLGTEQDQHRERLIKSPDSGIDSPLQFPITAEDVGAIRSQLQSAEAGIAVLDVRMGDMENHISVIQSRQELLNREFRRDINLLKSSTDEIREKQVTQEEVSRGFYRFAENVNNLVTVLRASLGGGSQDEVRNPRPPSPPQLRPPPPPANVQSLNRKCPRGSCPQCGKELSLSYVRTHIRKSCPVARSMMGLGI